MSEYAPLPDNTLHGPSSSDEQQPSGDEEWHEVLTERWNALMSLFGDSNTEQEHPVASAVEEQEQAVVVEMDPACLLDQQGNDHQTDGDDSDNESESDWDDDSSESSESSSDSDDSTQSPGDEPDSEEASLNTELLDLHQDVDHTCRSLADLETEFAEDLEALAQGLESAFENFGESGSSDVFVQTLVAQEDHLSQSTRSMFKARVKESLRRKRRSRNKKVLPRQAEMEQKQLLEKSVGINSAAATGTIDASTTASPTGIQDFDSYLHDIDDDEQFQNWFERFWAAIEDVLYQQAANKQPQPEPEPEPEEHPLAQAKNFFLSWSSRNLMAMGTEEECTTLIRGEESSSSGGSSSS